jgi:hypothetical protein
MREQQNWFLCVTYNAIGQVRLIFSYQRDDVLPWNIAGGNDREIAPGYAIGKANLLDAAARDRTANSCAVQHAREADVVDVLRRAGDFDPRFLARNGRSDNSTRHLFTLHGTAIIEIQS